MASTGSSENSRLDFEQLLETGRMLWPTYFQLAAMTFAWNASLATGAAFIFFRLQAAAPSQHADTLFLSWGVCVIATIGIVYNTGALSAYILMNRLHHSIISSVSGLGDGLDKAIVSQLLLGFVAKDRSQLLKHLTHLFFTLLCLCWLTVLIWMVYSRSGPLG